MKIKFNASSASWSVYGDKGDRLTLVVKVGQRHKTQDQWTFRSDLVAVLNESGFLVGDNGHVN